MNDAREVLSRDFATIAEVIKVHAATGGERRASVQEATAISYADLDAIMDRIAAGLQRDGIEIGEPVAMVCATTATSAAAFLGIVRAGCVPAPIAPSSTPAQIASMVSDSGTQLVFVDDEADHARWSTDVRTVSLDRFDDWLPPHGASPEPPSIRPRSPFNIIYSSRTTGTPKGIVHTHAMRWTQIRAYATAGFENAVTMVATPLYSNTTLVSLLPTLAYGGTVVLLGKFDARRFLEVAERERATHVMLVPIQYQRIMAVPDFDGFNLSSFAFKSSTSAPFSAELKADVVKRWPGLLLEVYGMTEGGGTCLLYANAFSNKLHTVGQPGPGDDIRLIDEEGREVPQGQIGEVVGRSGVMMAGYHNRPDATSASEWVDADGNRYIRHGDIGRFDEDGFLTLLGRSKDMIISGGFNIYPPDIEAVLVQHSDIVDAAVVGIPSQSWGETPYAFYVTSGGNPSPGEVTACTNERVGKTQRLSGAEPIDELPRSAIGKVLKRELRDRFNAA